MPRPHVYPENQLAIEFAKMVTTDEDAQRAACGQLVNTPVRKFFEGHGWYMGIVEFFSKRGNLYRLSKTNLRTMP